MRRRSLDGCHKNWGVNRLQCVPWIPGESKAVRQRLEEVLPPGPFLYPADEIAKDPVRFFVAEMIRETVFQEFHQEIPYSVFGQIEEFRENEDPVYIQAHLFVERNSQKRILIGKGGSSIRKLGTLSRGEDRRIPGAKGIP